MCNNIQLAASISEINRVEHKEAMIGKKGQKKLPKGTGCASCAWLGPALGGPFALRDVTLVQIEYFD